MALTLGISFAALRGQPTAVIADLVKVVQQGGNTKNKNLPQENHCPFPPNPSETTETQKGNNSWASSVAHYNLSMVL